jgi:hypothetical protein
MLAKSTPHSVHFVATRLDKRGIKIQALVVISIQENYIRNFLWPDRGRHFMVGES